MFAEEDDELLEAMILVLHEDIMMQYEEMNAIALMMGHIGGRVMGMLEDGIDLDDEDDGNRWEFVTSFPHEYRLLGDPCFRTHFRLRKATFEALLETVATHLVDAGRVHRIRNPFDEILLSVLWILANPDTFRSVGLRFHVRPGDLHFHYTYIIEALREMAPLYIQWPDVHERARIKARFEAYSGFPGIVGCLDGTYNNVTAPLEQKQGYINRHHQFSFNTMVVCDDNLLVRDLYIGEVGSMHDQRVFRRSPLYEQLLRDDERELLLADEHIVGDGAYAVTDFLMVPFRNVGNLAIPRARFNGRLSRCRARIEHTFGKAFAQWRRMKMLHSLNVELAVDHFTACFVLHNFMILNGEELLNLDDPDAFIPALDEASVEEEDEDDPEELEAINALEANARRRGAEKRLMLVENMQ